ncbi:gasdermin-A-like [Budorcas taxicolor]|uniref:gasdermin-A-like n=1 Tax=Budorcas taxicolor TaxID=37181 RepID=UPI002284C756|nr:gasdermin-A-like [Budorcas taxicolor]
MSSLFSRDTEGQVRELGRKGELVPTDSLASTLRLHPFCLLSRSVPICFKETVAGAVTRGGSLGTGQQGKAMGSGALSRSSLLAMQMLRSWKEKESLYVVTEATEAVQDATFQSQAEEPGGYLSSSCATSRCRGCPGGTNLVCRVLKATKEPTPPSWRTTHLTQECQSTVAKKKAVGIPQGTVLAYRVLQLVMRRITGAPVLYLPEGKLCRNASGGRAPGEGPGLQDLRRQAGAQLEALARLPPEPRLSLLGALRELLQSPRALQELKDRVTSILEPNYNQMEETGFSLHPEVLSWLHHEDAALTRSLVESCGLELRGPGHSVTRDPEVVPQLSVLYASLSGLQLLAEPSSTALQADA